jgi:hypothetical protein
LVDRQFDRLARSLATGTSRRAGFRLIVGATAAVLSLTRRHNSAAGPATVPLGGVCWDSGQCSQAEVDHPFRAVCEENGFDYDGPFNCCVTSDNRCWANEHCCGMLECIVGFCMDYGAYINTLGDQTDAILPGTADGVGSLGLGEPCGDPVQCYSGSGTETTCADNGIDAGGVCCTFYGFGCGSDRHCCGSLICPNGFCTVPYEGYG